MRPEKNIQIFAKYKNKTKFWQIFDLGGMSIPTIPSLAITVLRRRSDTACGTGESYVSKNSKSKNSVYL